jgi:ribose 5-phosphate isomerase B
MSNNNIINSIVISADHAGFELKNELKAFLSENYPEIKIIDAGAFEYDAEDDFPDMTNKLTEIIHNGDADKGIAICGSGVGASIVANKTSGIRAAVCHDVYSASQGVQHNNMNVLCMGGRVIKISEAKKIVKSFLDASFIDEEKYVRRLNKINKLD